MNGIQIAYRVQGSGPALLLIMGYRLSGDAWPAEFIDSLAQRFTVVTFDNRGTGASDKPVCGYALDNMARDAAGLLDHLGIERAHVFGYSMGGAIAQEFALHYPERVVRLILCATMCGGPMAAFAGARVQRIMRNVAGLPPVEAGRRIWTVTYAPDYLARDRDLAERQLQREIARPTPQHAADLQFQALASFDTSARLRRLSCPVLVMTGDLDALVLPRNAEILASLIRDARLRIFPGRGHRLIWESTEESVETISDFLTGATEGEAQASVTPSSFDTARFLNMASRFAWFWPDAMNSMARALFLATGFRFGNGTPVIVVAGPFLPSLIALPMVRWLTASGYRASLESEALNDRILREADRWGRKVVLLSFAGSAIIDRHIDEDAASKLSCVVYVFEKPGDRIDGVPAFRLSAPMSNLFIEVERFLADRQIELLPIAAPPSDCAA